MLEIPLADQDMEYMEVSWLFFPDGVIDSFSRIGLYRLIVSETYFPPQIPSRVPVSSLIRQHNNDWRTTFVERPRIRLNGAYIAAYHYTRPGMHEDNVWVKVIHVSLFVSEGHSL